MTKIDMNVCVVEDNPSDARIVTNMLKDCRRFTFNLWTQDSLENINCIIEDNKIDIILLDLTLRDSSKDSTIDRIKEMSETLPVVIITSDDDDRDIEKVFELGAQEYLIKSRFDKDLLVKTLDYSLQRWRSNKKLIQSARKIEELEKFQLYIDVAGIFIVSLDIDGNIMHINKMGCALLGKNKENIIGKNWFETFIPDRIRKEVRGVFDNILRNNLEAGRNYDNFIIGNNGEERLIRWDSAYIKDNQNNILGTLSAGTDITEQDKADKALRKSLEDLEKYELASIGRENVMIGLKREVNALSLELGKPAPYDLTFLEE